MRQWHCLTNPTQLWPANMGSKHCHSSPVPHANHFLPDVAQDKPPHPHPRPVFCSHGTSASPWEPLLLLSQAPAALELGLSPPVSRAVSPPALVPLPTHMSVTKRSPDRNFQMIPSFVPCQEQLWTVVFSGFASTLNFQPTHCDNHTLLRGS